MAPSRKKSDGDGRGGGDGGRGKRKPVEQEQRPPFTPNGPPPLLVQSTLRLEDVAPEPLQAPALPFPVVCVGASAGGLEAFTQLLESLPTDTGMAFVLVSHLSPSHAS